MRLAEVEEEEVVEEGDEEEEVDEWRRRPAVSARLA